MLKKNQKLNVIYSEILLIYLSIKLILKRN